MIEVTFSGESLRDIRIQIRDFLGVETTPAAAQPEAVQPAAVVKLKDVSKPAQAKTDPAVAPTPVEQPVTAPTSYKDVAEYVPKAVSKYGRGKIVTLLEGFGAKTGKDLKSEQYGEVMAKLKAEYPL